MSLKLRLLVSVISLVVVTILMMAVVSVNVAVDASTEALENAARERLLVQNVQTSESLSEYFATIEKQVRSKSFSLDTQQAAQAFVQAYQQYANQRGTLSSAERNRLADYYDNDFSQHYASLNPRTLQGASQVLSRLSDAALALQHDFIAASSFPLGGKDGLVALNNGSAYDQAHQRYHPSLQHFLNEFGYYDIFIADAQSGDIVYSVYKELDFATNIVTGPYAGSGIGEAFKRARQLNNPDDVVFSSFEDYRPSYDALAGFAASPIQVDGRTVAILIFQMPMDHISAIMTHSNKWQEKGYGASGETYLVDEDSVLLSESRFFVEDKANYLAAIRGKYPAEAKRIDERNTSVGIQPVRSESSRRALEGNSGFMLVKDYRDVEVYSAYSPISLGKHRFALLAEIDVSEALAPAEALSRELFVSALLETIVLLTIAVVVVLWLARLLTQPLDRLGEMCEALAQGEGDLTVQLEASKIPEINRISHAFNQFIGQVRDIISMVKSDADTLASSAEELSAITLQSENTATQQRDQTAMVATAMEQFSASINEVSRSMVDTRDHSLNAQKSLHENMERAGMAAQNIKLLVQLIGDSSTVISSLKSEVEQITSALNVITSLADQTNLLALNAAIEAARAGEAGRGFSVVADEVRALATRSQESTVEISRIVDGMVKSSERSVERMERASRAADGGIHLVDLVNTAMNELEANLKVVLEMAETVAAASEQQNTTSASVLENVNNINELATDAQQGASQTSASSNELSRIASRTQELVARFKV
ncbi:methyl-accepting chemotaxis protein [Aestuariibacter halophilus]|uniref:Methyl-accepting chemotaxis protein n=1 Tax=Fluctibacter halophilus TaxID=226011 RepID=A0ABS8G7I3_9ALTE|nr:methyl-accepting chemotaxis protein [Aestuariibacter halophilus]MCC2615196.1 methyl-accepting chemotaxis protein [Aestuariibacter halophilus]